MYKMQCHCEHKKHIFEKEMGKDFRCCPANIPYKNHHDWGREEDYMCQECVEECI